MSAPRPGRRAALASGGALLAGAAALASGKAVARGTAATLPARRAGPGGGLTNRGVPDAAEGLPIRWTSPEPSAPGTGASWTPLHELEGTWTPTALHFERHHAGVPAIDPARWRLAIDGDAARPASLDLGTLRAGPLATRACFLECSGNSAALWRDEPVQAPAGWLHGLVSMSQWTGVPLAHLLAEARPGRGARWLIADGLDGSGMRVSLPLATLPPDALVALYHDGEPLHAAHGAPARLVLPGLEGVANVKWLGRLHLADRPAMSRFDTVAYAELHADARLHRFTRRIGVKSVLCRPTTGDAIARGRARATGLAWSGAGPVARVEYSLDGGGRWREARLEGVAGDRALVRFRFEFDFVGRGLSILTRATDAGGAVQPGRAAFLAERGRHAGHHFEAITGVAVEPDGRVRHAYA